MFGSRLIQHVQHVLSHRATQDTLWRGIDFACVSLRGLALAIAAARALGPAQWGVLGATFAVFALGRPIANLALGAKMPALIGRGQLNHQQAAGLLLWTRPIAGLITAVFIYWIAVNLIPSSLPNAPTSLVLIFAAWLVFGFPTPLKSLLYQTRRFRAAAILSASMATAFTITAVCLLVIKAPIEWFAIAIFSDSVIATIALAFLLRPNLRIPALRTRKLAFGGIPLLTIALLCAGGMRQLSIILLNSLGSAEEAGLYWSAEKFILLGTIPGAMIIGALRPRINKGTPELIDESLTSGAQFLSIVGWVVMLGIAISGPFLIPLVFGDKYEEASKLVPILSPIVLLSNGMLFLTWAAVAHGRYKLLLVANLSGLATLTLGCSLLIPVFGPTGAAIANLTALIVSVLLSCTLAGGSTSIRYSVATAAGLNPLYSARHVWRQIRSFGPTQQ